MSEPSKESLAAVREVLPCAIQWISWQGRQYFCGDDQQCLECDRAEQLAHLLDRQLAQARAEERGKCEALRAAGDAKTPGASVVAALLEQVSAAQSLAEIDELARGARQAWTPAQRAEIKVAFDARREQIRVGDDPSNGFGDEPNTPEAMDPGVTDPESSAAGVSPWTNATPSKCAECGVLRSKAASHGHNGECSLAGEK